MKLGQVKIGGYFTPVEEAKAAISGDQVIRVFRRLHQSSETQPPEKGMIYASWGQGLGSFSEDTEVVACDA